MMDALRRLVQQLPFPDPESADAHGLLAYGGDLSPERLLAAYAQGVFPWFDEPPVLWFSPDPRAVLEPERLVVNRTLAKNLRRGRYAVRADTAFGEVIRACASVPRAGQQGTWIGPEMIEAYEELHRLGFAHSVEAWREGTLVGGIYGVSLGGAFFGESMFARSSDASKVALVHLVRRLQAWRFDFLDCQVGNPHTTRLGARPWPRAEFLAALDEALDRPTRRGPWTSAFGDPPPTPGAPAPPG